MRFANGAALLMGVALLGAQAARADTIEAGDQAFTTLANWNAAATATGEDTFDTAPGQGNAALYSNASGFTDTLGIDYVGSFDTGNYYLEIVNPTLSTYFNYGSGSSLDSGLAQSGRSPYLEATLPGGVTSVSLDVMTYGNVYPVTLTASDGTTVTVSTASLQQTFYGFTFSAPISWFKVSVPGAPNFTSVLIDNFTFGAADVAAPESASGLMIGIGLVFLACIRKTPRPA